jgi:hypothetical protein
VSKCFFALQLPRMHEQNVRAGGTIGDIARQGVAARCRQVSSGDARI